MNKTAKFVELVRSAGIIPRTIFDVGAFDCAETVELALAFPNSEVYAFECVPKLLSHADDVTRIYKNIHLIPVALSDKPGLRVFNESISGNQECGSLLTPNGKYFEPMPTRQIIVPVYTIQGVLLDFPAMFPPDIMWMDVQGCETKVLKGMEEFISKLKMFWAEVTYTAYYDGQMCVDEFDRIMNLWGYEKIYEEIGIKDWFGNACYRRKNGV